MEQQEQQQIDAAQVMGIQRGNERLGAQIASLTGEVEFWKIKAEQAQQLLQALQEAGIDFEAVLTPPEADESAEDAPESPESDFPVSAPLEDGDDAPATP